MRIFNYARPPVTRRHVRDIEPAVAVSIPPFQFHDVLKSEIGNQVEHVMWDYQRRRSSTLPPGLPRDGAQRVPVQMVEMGVSNQNHIHRRQVAKVQSRFPYPFQKK